MSQALCVPNDPSIALHLTSPGQGEHDEALSDDLLWRAGKRFGDNAGTLKIFVHNQGSSNGLGVDFNNGNSVTSPFGQMIFYREAA